MRHGGIRAIAGLVAAGSMPFLAHSVSAEPGENTDAATDGAIGFIICSSGMRRTATTATVVENRRTILTVAHFDSDGKSGKLPVSNCRFRLGDNVKSRAPSYALTLSERGGDALQNRISRATDWAVLELDREVPGHVRPMLMPASRNSDRTAAFFEGFERSKRDGFAKFARRQCALAANGVRSVLVRHDCPTEAGSSGAPLFANRNGRREIVALHVGRTGGAGLAIALTRQTVGGEKPDRENGLTGAVGVTAGG